LKKLLLELPDQDVHATLADHGAEQNPLISSCMTCSSKYRPSRAHLRRETRAELVEIQPVDGGAPMRFDRMAF
jgi:hypothetical protein